ncbi:hypothetical protein M0812_19431 [Anaeramoeba flamelloides]|uniref:SHSP domain-containing protein n=1 Tax=Anaeramoeba flamelloides TaxID=1746091 RepID=A0AAV7Z1L8_9EUKA|nr:hypothetical protein M0812_19431 [Anaeramoeba flamelloides]
MKHIYYFFFFFFVISTINVNGENGYGDSTDQPRLNWELFKRFYDCVFNSNQTDATIRQETTKPDQKTSSGVGDFEQYDMELNITSIPKLVSEGWPLRFSNDEAMDLLNRNRSAIVVGISGSRFNAGKTFVLNRLTKRNFACGTLVHTEGISVINSGKHIFVDSLGADKFIEGMTTTDRVITDEMVRLLTLRLSKVYIYVVNQLKASDIVKVEDTYQKLTSNNPTAKMIIVHNYQTLTTEEEILKYTKEDIEVALQGERSKTEKGYIYTSRNGNIIHVALANETSDIGKRINSNSFDYIKIILRATVGTQRVWFLKELETVMHGILHNYLQTPGMEKMIPETTSLIKEVIKPDGTKNIIIQEWEQVITFFSKIFQRVKGFLKQIKQFKGNFIFYFFGEKSEESFKDPFVMTFLKEENSYRMRTEQVYQQVHYKNLTETSQLDAYFETRLDSYTTPDHQIITVDLPGVPKSYLAVQCKRTSVEIKGVRPIPQLYKEKPPSNINVIQIQQRRFSNFYLEVDINDAYTCNNEYLLENGVLTIMNPKDKTIHEL